MTAASSARHGRRRCEGPHFKKHEAFAELSSLLASLAGQDVRRCLVSDLKAHKGTVTKGLLAHDANAVIDDWYATKTPAELTKLEPELMREWNGTRGSHPAARRERVGIYVRLRAVTGAREV